MPLTNIQGYDGGITLPTSAHAGTIQRWNASFSRVTSNVTGFADSVSRNRVGILEISGSASGTPTYDAANTSPGVSNTVAGGSALTLTVATGCSYAFTAAFNAVNLSSDKRGDATLEFSFVNGDSNTFTETWDQS